MEGEGKINNWATCREEQQAEVGCQRIGGEQQTEGKDAQGRIESKVSRAEFACVSRDEKNSLNG